MLILTRSPQQWLDFYVGEKRIISVKCVNISSTDRYVRLGIEADNQFRVVRRELRLHIQPEADDDGD